MNKEAVCQLVLNTLAGQDETIGGEKSFGSWKKKIDIQTLYFLS